MIEAVCILPVVLAAAAVPDSGADKMRPVLEQILDALDELEPRHPAAGGDELVFPTLKFFIEFNETDEDVGVQCSLGGEPYKTLSAYRPDGRKILDLTPRRNLRRQGLSDFFFESAEPSLDEFSMDDFLDRFDEGIYEFESVTVDNLEQDGEAEFTHVVPAGPVITNPLEGDVVDPTDLVVTWEPVTMTTAFNPPQVPVEIVRYQVILTREDPLHVYQVDLPGTATSVSVPPEYLDAGTEYEVEVIAVEPSDNQTISLLFFETEE